MRRSISTVFSSSKGSKTMIDPNRGLSQAARALGFFWLLAILSPVALAQPTPQTAIRPAQPYFTDPALSPDGSEIAFVSGGDVWTVAATGGEAHLLVSHAATESRPLYAPDGRRLAFGSTRTGNGDIYILTIDT